MYQKKKEKKKESDLLFFRSFGCLKGDGDVEESHQREMILQRVYAETEEEGAKNCHLMYFERP